MGSDSQSATQSQSAQTSVQGASASNSPTNTAGQNLTVNDPSIALAAIAAAGSAINASLNQSGAGATASINALNTLASTQQQNQAAQAQNNNQLLSSVLSATQQLATAQGTGGASLTYNTNNYLIWALAGIAALVVGFLAFGNRKTA